MLARFVTLPLIRAASPTARIAGCKLSGMHYSTRPVKGLVETDECAIPVQPTWSVNDLLSSYPKPSISPAKLKHLHELSALLPPEEGSAEHAILTEEMQDLAKLVEAVRLADLHELAEEGVPDGRVWADGIGIDLKDQDGVPALEDEVRGRDLLTWAPRMSNEMYVVETDKRRK
ncbi:hypothetical protein GLOTRDRAFT_136436 [Gloeophyllum trabeum ATCC 11539]|uniref:Uncharacterized protein n=1 Tax=Gloeophyllum trabeum (strain ATCC 11539 / FP-39264 / Madison 617) TaxID=670483 RepID=S7RXG1_GLOTA|nr:uncharacterized protein GLOTRDRAFT_136436 [Gloeophyllum trabeum ATCC 11539]EPQ59605.1 hypothetical protein GLOTRDRAFT_136436 [Gloeophyllum trabeum ATCC 11539]